MLAAGVATLAILFVLLAVVAHRRGAALQAIRTCFVTGGGELRVCHAASAEGVYYRPGPRQIAYNTQIIARADGSYATVLHSESEDSEHYWQATGRVRPGDSIKAGTSDNPYAAPANLGFRIWGSLNNPASALYTRYDNPNSPAGGLSGGANPMVVAGRRAAGDPYFYMFYLGVTSDELQGKAWRDVLLEARTRDFGSFDLLQQDAAHKPVWVTFAGENAAPALVTDTAGHSIVSNDPAPVERGDKPDRPRGAVITAGEIGSVAHVGDRYFYFYTDQDPSDPARDHLYVRTAQDISSNARWSEPSAILDMPPEILVRVAKARGMDRWAVIYSCLRSTQPVVVDVCLQYTQNLNLTGPGGIGSLQLFDGPAYTGRSRYALGLVGADPSFDSGAFIKGQQLYMTDEDGNLAVPRQDDPARSDVGGLLTWMDLPRNRAIFGAPTYWAEWQVSGAGTALGSHN